MSAAGARHCSGGRDLGGVQHFRRGIREGPHPATTTQNRSQAERARIASCVDRRPLDVDRGEVGVGRRTLDAHTIAARRVEARPLGEEGPHLDVDSRLLEETPAS